MTPRSPSGRWSLTSASVSSTAPSLQKSMPKISHVIYEKVSNDAEVPFWEVESDKCFSVKHRAFSAEVNDKISHVLYEKVFNDADVPFWEGESGKCFRVKHRAFSAEVNDKISHVI